MQAHPTDLKSREDPAVDIGSYMFTFLEPEQIFGIWKRRDWLEGQGLELSRKAFVDSSRV